MTDMGTLESAVQTLAPVLGFLAAVVVMNLLLERTPRIGRLCYHRYQVVSADRNWHLIRCRKCGKTCRDRHG